nr:MAG TPA: hypothetical protein [Bacteriophage sp.]
MQSNIFLHLLCLPCKHSIVPQTTFVNTFLLTS